MLTWRRFLSGMRMHPIHCGRSTPHVLADPAASRREHQARLHRDRAPRRDHHHRHPARDRSAVHLGFRDRATDSAAKANVHSALPAVAAFYAGNGAYTGMTEAALQAIDQNVSLDGAPVVTATTYFIDSTVSGSTEGLPGPTPQPRSRAPAKQRPIWRRRARAPRCFPMALTAEGAGRRPVAPHRDWGLLPRRRREVARERGS